MQISFLTDEMNEDSYEVWLLNMLCCSYVISYQFFNESRLMEATPSESSF